MKKYRLTNDNCRYVYLPCIPPKIKGFVMEEDGYYTVVLNPALSADTNKKTVYQYIDFATRNDKSTYTYFDLPKRRLKIADRLIRVFEEDGGCKPFTVYILYE